VAVPVDTHVRMNRRQDVATAADLKWWLATP
jgi:hypothetical protein